MSDNTLNLGDRILEEWDTWPGGETWADPLLIAASMINEKTIARAATPSRYQDTPPKITVYKILPELIYPNSRILLGSILLDNKDGTISSNFPTRPIEMHDSTSEDTRAKTAGVGVAKGLLQLPNTKDMLLAMHSFCMFSGLVPKNNETLRLRLFLVISPASPPMYVYQHE